MRDSLARSESGVAEGPIVRPVLPENELPDWRALFGAERPLHCEIGPGKGHFALDFASSNSVNLVAVEIRRSDCEWVRRQRDRRSLANLDVIQGDARLLLPRLFTEGSVDGFHIHFPDPWWKKRHYRRRLVADDFGLLLWRLLKPDGLVDVRTDVAAYAKTMVETFETLLPFDNVFGPAVERPAERLILSGRERRYAASGQPVFRYLFRRADRGPVAIDISRSWRRREWSDIRRK